MASRPQSRTFSSVIFRSTRRQYRSGSASVARLLIRFRFFRKLSFDVVLIRVSNSRAFFTVSAKSSPPINITRDAMIASQKIHGPKATRMLSRTATPRAHARAWGTYPRTARNTRRSPTTKRAPEISNRKSWWMSARSPQNPFRYRFTGAREEPAVQKLYSQARFRVPMAGVPGFPGGFPYKWRVLPDFADALPELPPDVVPKDPGATDG